MNSLWPTIVDKDCTKQLVPERIDTSITKILYELEDLWKQDNDKLVRVPCGNADLIINFFSNSECSHAPRDKYWCCFQYGELVELPEA